MDSKQETQEKPVVKPKRNRRFQKEIINETASAQTLRVKHTPHKGEKISDTIRKDHKFNPKQRFADQSGRSL